MAHADRRPSDQILVSQVTQSMIIREISDMLATREPIVPTDMYNSRVMFG